MSKTTSSTKPLSTITSIITPTGGATATTFSPHAAPLVTSANRQFLQWQMSCVLSLGVLFHWLGRIRVCIIIDDFIGPGVGLYFYWT